MGIVPPFAAAPARKPNQGLGTAGNLVAGAPSRAMSPWRYHRQSCCRRLRSQCLLGGTAGNLVAGALRSQCLPGGTAGNLVAGALRSQCLLGGTAGNLVAGAPRSQCLPG